MQRMAELVEIGRRVVPRDENGLTWRALHEVRVVRRQNRLFFLERLVAAIASGPCARALAGPRKWVEIPESDVRAGGLVRHLPDSYIILERGHGSVRHGRE